MSRYAASAGLVAVAIVMGACASDSASTTPEASVTTQHNDDPAADIPTPSDLIASDTRKPTTTSTETSSTEIPSTESPSTETASSTTAPSENDAAPRSFAETVYERGVVDGGLSPFVNAAKEDLAERLEIDVENIETLTGVLVVWPDASLGCAEPGMSYAQATADGSVIELGVDSEVYRYHSGGSTSPFLCERPLSDPPTPG